MFVNLCYVIYPTCAVFQLSNLHCLYTYIELYTKVAFEPRFTIALYITLVTEIIENQYQNDLDFKGIPTLKMSTNLMWKRNIQNGRTEEERMEMAAHGRGTKRKENHRMVTKQF